MHAVFQEGVSYKDLELVIYDEQHMFADSQRLKLKEKEEDYPHLLMLWQRQYQELWQWVFYQV